MASKKQKIGIVAVLVLLVGAFIAWKKGFLLKGTAINFRNFKNAEGQIFTPMSKGYDLIVNGLTVTIKGRTDITGQLLPDGAIKWSNGNQWDAA